MEKNYLPGILWVAGGLICLAISYSTVQYHLVIKGTHLSYGWLAVALGVIRLIFPPDD